MLLQSMGDSQKPAAKIDSSTAETKACPVGREDLGRFTWALLHTTAAWFPEKPDDADKTAARQLVDSLARLYPWLCFDLSLFDTLLSEHRSVGMNWNPLFDEHVSIVLSHRV